MREFLKGLGDSSRIGLVVFDEDVDLAVPLMPGAGLRAEARFLKSLEKINYRGRLSDSPGAVERAIYELKTKGRPDACKVIVLLSDGIVDTGQKSRDLEREKWLKDILSLESRKAGIRIFGIAFTNAADFSVMQTLAMKTNGEYFRAYRAEDIPAVFSRIHERIAEPIVEPEKPIPPSIQAVVPAPSPVPPVKAVKPEVKVVPTPVPPPKSTLEDHYLKILLFGILVILVVIGAILVWNRKSQPSLVRHEGLAEELAAIPEAELIDVNNVTGKKKFVLNKRITKIGRDKNNDVAIPEDTVSSLHATIEYIDGFFYLEDQRSTNKTRLEGETLQPYTPRRLKSGDEIMFNVHKFIFMLPDQIPSGETEVDFDATAQTVIKQAPGVPEVPELEAGEIPQAMLVDVNNVTGKKTYKLDKTVTKIGRAGSNDLAVPKDTVSGFHATIEYRDGHFFLEDQRSTNKTFLNGEEIEPYTPKRLKSGDEIMLDVCKFIFLLERQYPSGETDKR